MRPALAALALALAGGCISRARQQKAAAQVDLGRAYLVEGSTESAISALQHATKLDRRNVSAWNELGLALMKRGELEGAEDAFERALRLDPDRARTNLDYAFLLQKLGRNDEAIPLLEHALRDVTYRYPVRVLNNLGFALLQAGQPDQAIDRLEEAVRRAPTFCPAWLNLGLARETAGHREKAIEAYDKLVMTCDDFAVDGYLHGGLVMLDVGRRDEGAQYLSKVIELDPGSPRAKAAADRLQAEGLR